MIKVFLYAYFDKKAHSFGAPFTAVNDEVAKRSFAGLIQDAGNRLAILDTDLYKIGVYDCDTGVIIPGTDKADVEYICDYYTARAMIGGQDE